MVGVESGEASSQEKRLLRCVLWLGLSSSKAGTWGKFFCREAPGYVPLDATPAVYAEGAAVGQAPDLSPSVLLLRAARDEWTGEGGGGESAARCR